LTQLPVAGSRRRCAAANGTGVATPAVTDPEPVAGVVGEPPLAVAVATGLAAAAAVVAVAAAAGGFFPHPGKQTSLAVPPEMGYVFLLAPDVAMAGLRRAPGEGIRYL
jgi:hypothetical protein